MKPNKQNSYSDPRFNAYQKSLSEYKGCDWTDEPEDITLEESQKVLGMKLRLTDLNLVTKK